MAAVSRGQAWLCARLPGRDEDVFAALGAKRARVADEGGTHARREGY